MKAHAYQVWYQELCVPLLKVWDFVYDSISRIQAELKFWIQFLVQFWVEKNKIWTGPVQSRPVQSSPYFVLCPIGEESYKHLNECSTNSNMQEYCYCWEISINSEYKIDGNCCSVQKREQKTTKKQSERIKCWGHCFCYSRSGCCVQWFIQYQPKMMSLWEGT